MIVTEKTNRKQLFTVSSKARTTHCQWNYQVAGFSQKQCVCTCTKAVEMVVPDKLRVCNTTTQNHRTKILTGFTKNVFFLFSCIFFFRPLISQGFNCPEVCANAGVTGSSTRWLRCCIWMIELPSASLSEGHTYSTVALDCTRSLSLLPHK